MKLFFIFSFAAIIFFTISCSAPRHITTSENINHLKFLSEYDVPFNKNFQNTIVGGLSGIDYNAREDVYYLICDDRSERNPARFYEANVIIKENKIDDVVFSNVKFLKNIAGNNYPDSHNDPYHTPDPEAMRYNSRTNTFVWSSEGERIVKPNNIVLEDPSITEITAEGNYIDTFILPSQLHMHATERGPRQNGIFEGLTFADDYKTLFVNVEEPLYDDGSRAGLNDSTGIIRIIKFGMDSKKPEAQYAYIVDPVAHSPFPANAFKINGVSDILYAGKNELLVIERSYSAGRLACTIKVFLADLSSAENVSDIASLKNRTGIKTVQKKLLLNMDSLGFYIDNIEGVTFGPTLANGHRTLVFVADNNFQFIEKTQFLLFEID
jgi:hypothetical protein